MSTTLMTASHEWATRPADQRYQSLDALCAAVRNRRMRSAAFDEPLTDLRVRVEGDDLVIGNGRTMRPTHWSFGQYAGLLKAPASFLRTLSPTTAATVLNECVSQAPRTAMKIMTVRSAQGTVLQAVTSTTYGRIWDADVVDSVQHLVDRTGGKFYNPKAYDPETNQPVPSGLYASDRDIFIFMIDGGSVFDQGPRAQLNRGFIVSNSEVGKARLRLMTFFFNVVCGNHIIWGASDVREFNLIHAEHAPERFERDAMPYLLSYVNSSPNLTPIVRAQSFRLKDLPGINNEIYKPVSGEWVKVFAQQRGFTLGEVTDAIDTARREEGKCDTLWDLVQGFTACARDYQFVDARTDLERRASQLLNLVGTN